MVVWQFAVDYISHIILVSIVIYLLNTAFLLHFLLICFLCLILFLMVTSLDRVLDPFFIVVFGVLDHCDICFSCF